MSTRRLRRHMPLLVLFSTVVSLPGGLPGSVSAQVPADSTVVLSGGAYVDLRAGRLRSNGAIVIQGGTIVAMHAPDAGWRAPADARVLSLEGHTILPGLIDAHVHLTIAGTPAENAAATLRAGFTTVIDLGSADGAGVRLRDQIAGGRVLGPTVIAAGSWIGSKGGVCEFGGATVGSEAEAAARAQSDLSQGADLLKVCVTGWPAEAVAFPDSVQFKADLLTSVTEAAVAAGRPVYAHAIGRAGALLAAAHGARALAHTPIVDADDANRLRSAGIYVISTLATLTKGDGADRVRRSFQLLRRAGVTIVLGTDAGVLPHGSNAGELVALTENGLSPLEALRAATLDAAALLRSTRIGEIAVGRAGDFVVVDGDPIRNLRALERPVMVLRGGRVVPAAKPSP
jgi:imidazolonepropionase-like amidohydrolase